MSLGVTGGGDPNWLLSTDAQVNAALVAFIGGLLVARLAGLAKDKAVAAGRREAAQAVLKEAEDACELDEGRRRKAVVRRLRADLLQELVRSRGGGRLRPQVLMQGKTWDLSDGPPDDEVETIKAKVASAFDEIGREIAAKGVRATWAEAKGAYSLPVDGDDDEMVYEAVYDDLLQAREQAVLGEGSRERERLRDEARRSVAALRASEDVAALRRAQERLLAVERDTPRPRSQPRPELEHRYGPDDRAHLKAVTDDVARSRLAVANARLQLVAARAAENRAAAPANVRAALLSLSWLSVTGLALPLVLLATQPRALAWPWRVLLVALPAIGLVALFIALVRGLVPGGFQALLGLRPAAAEQGNADAAAEPSG